jgi:membrane-associated phospholipid phosphatase
MFLSFLLLTAFYIKGQTQQSHPLKKDTLNLALKQNRKFWKRMAVPSVFFGLSALSWRGREDVRAIRNRYIPNFNCRLDDYMQYAPAATVFALNLAGVKGRNRPVRAAINCGGSLLIMSGLVNAVKYSSRVTRPDEMANNSFPSGHTAMAFMNASFLHKEYGHVNSLYGTLGYTLSTFTGISRILNNRHWLPDVLAGAGIGVLSTELSYLIVDNMYKNRGDFFSDFDTRVELEKPSFLTIKAGQAFYPNIRSSQKPGLEGALEGAYFFNKKWGIGAEIGFMHIPFNKESLDSYDWALISETVSIPDISAQSSGLASFMAGAYYSKYLGTKFILQGKLSAGMGICVGENISTGGRRNMEIPSKGYPSGKIRMVGAGISATAMLAPATGLSLYADYKYVQSKMNIPHANILSFGAGLVSFFSL